MKRYFFLLISLIIASSAVLTAQNDSLTLNREMWQNISEELSYDDPLPSDEEIEKEKDKSSGSSGTNLDAKIISPFAFVLLIVLALVVITLLLKRSRTTVKVSRKRIEAQSIDEAEENLPDVALDNILDEAIQSADYRAALRIKFLMVLQKLLDHKRIIWRKHKTNESYIQEIQNENIKLKFTQLVNIFDDVWYGKLIISESMFNKMNETVESLNQLLDEQQQ